MAHNIHTLPEEAKMAKTLDNPSGYYEGQEERGGEGGSKILTVVDSSSGRQIRILFTRISDTVVINPWGDYVRIEGEDLYALRELLNELPESAFVRPADPVDPSVKALQDAPPGSIAIDKTEVVYRCASTSRAQWVHIVQGRFLPVEEVARRGAKIVWTPGGDA